MALPDLCTAIKALGISKIRLVQFGQKSKLKNFRNFPFRLALPSSEDNGENDGPDIETYVDVGKFVQTESIALINWAPVSDNIQAMSGSYRVSKSFLYGSCGDGAGWVQAKFRNTSFKVYPHLTHSVKPTIRVLDTVPQKASNLCLSHYRIEARLKVSSLSNLMSQVLELPIWSSNQLRHLGITIKSVRLHCIFNSLMRHFTMQEKIDSFKVTMERNHVKPTSWFTIFAEPSSCQYFGGFQFSIGDGGLDEPKNRRLRWRCAGCKSSYTIDNVVDCALRPFLALISKDQGRERHGLPAIDHLFNPLSAESARVFRTQYIPHNVSLVHVNPSQGERYAESDAESDANPGPGPDTYWKVTRTTSASETTAFQGLLLTSSRRQE
ncbi:hypothetical protein BC829DRAFT_423682 [Chytridium lagenaria]|nr:hypothetical protein BC829DRAFT_423682 [Chytridium lagenaria]